MSRFIKLFAVLLTITLVSACEKKADDASNGATDEAIKNYIMNHPDVIIQSLQAYQHKSTADQDKNIGKTIASHHDDIFKDSDSAVYGNPNGKIQIVEFFDYNCGYCKRVLPDLVKITADNKDVKVIFKEMAILGPTSKTAALAALVVHDIAPKKYFAFHSELMTYNGQKDEAGLKALADKVGVNGEKMLEKMKEPKYEKILQSNLSLAHDLNIQGTPTFLVNTQIIRGAVGYDGLKSIVTNTKPMED